MTRFFIFCLLVLVLASACSDSTDSHNTGGDNDGETLPPDDGDLDEEAERLPEDPEEDPDGGSDGDPDGEFGGDSEEPPLSLSWASISGGSFQMGCVDNACRTDELPVRTCSVPAFEMLATEVTQAQYLAVIGKNPSHFQGCDDCPVEEISHADAEAFCRAVGARLPSETEWEYAARAGTDTSYYSGNEESGLDGIAWYYDNSGAQSHPVGEKTPNDFGLFDMLGNVYEWVADCWHDNYQGAPETAEAWTGGDCSIHVLRGGCWDGYARKLRVFNRLSSIPPVDGAVGFRCVR